MPICRVCGTAAGEGRHQVREMLTGTREPFAYFQCPACGCLQIETIPDDLGRFYAAGYYSYKPAQRPASRLKRLAAAARGRHALSGTGLIGRLLYARMPLLAMRSLRPLHPTPATRMLDVGCGAGHLIHALAELGYTEVSGIDPFIDRDLRYDNGASVRRADIDGVHGEWDVLMFHHSFEHLPDPQHTLARALALLAPGGHAVLRVPTVSSHAWAHYGVDWVQLDAPRHLFLHSRESIAHLAQASGFELTAVMYDSEAFQFWGSEQYRRDIALNEPRSYARDPAGSLFSPDEIKTFKRRAAELNRQQLGDQAAFYLRKPVQAAAARPRSSSNSVSRHWSRMP